MPGTSRPYLQVPMAQHLRSVSVAHWVPPQILQPHLATLFPTSSTTSWLLPSGPGASLRPLRCEIMKDPPSTVKLVTKAQGSLHTWLCNDRWEMVDHHRFGDDRWEPVDTVLPSPRPGWTVTNHIRSKVFRERVPPAQRRDAFGRPALKLISVSALLPSSLPFPFLLIPCNGIP